MLRQQASTKDSVSAFLSKSHSKNGPKKQQSTVGKPGGRQFLRGNRYTAGDLPMELLLLIFENVAKQRPADLNSCRLVNKHWMAAADDNFIWKVVYHKFVAKGKEQPKLAQAVHPPHGFWRRAVLRDSSAFRHTLIQKLLKRATQEYTGLPIGITKTLAETFEVQISCHAYDERDKLLFRLASGEHFWHPTSLHGRWDAGQRFEAENGFGEESSDDYNIDKLVFSCQSGLCSDRASLQSGPTHSFPFLTAWLRDERVKAKTKSKVKDDDDDDGNSWIGHRSKRLLMADDGKLVKLWRLSSTCAGQVVAATWSNANKKGSSISHDLNLAWVSVQIPYTSLIWCLSKSVSPSFAASTERLEKLHLPPPANPLPHSKLFSFADAMNDVEIVVMLRNARKVFWSHKITNFNVVAIEPMMDTHIKVIGIRSQTTGIETPIVIHEDMLDIAQLLWRTSLFKGKLENLTILDVSLVYRFKGRAFQFASQSTLEVLAPNSEENDLDRQLTTDYAMDYKMGTSWTLDSRPATAKCDSEYSKRFKVGVVLEATAVPEEERSFVHRFEVFIPNDLLLTSMPQHPHNKSSKEKSTEERGSVSNF